MCFFHNGPGTNLKNVKYHSNTLNHTTRRNNVKMHCHALKRKFDYQIHPLKLIENIHI